jgi:hypothetical protein
LLGYLVIKIRGLLGLPLVIFFQSLLAKGNFFVALLEFRKTSAKRKEVKGSEKADEYGLSISGFSGIYLWLRRDGKQRDKSEMPEMWCSFYNR